MSGLISPKVRGRVEGGKFIPEDKATFKKAFYCHEGKEVDLTVKRHRENRSEPQNRYYFGVVVAMVAESMGEDDPGAVHDMLKAEFNYEIVVVGKNKEMKKPLSTADLDTAAFSEYLERVKKWASEFLNLYIPDPSEVDV